MMLPHVLVEWGFPLEGVGRQLVMRKRGHNFLLGRGRRLFDLGAITPSSLSTNPMLRRRDARRPPNTSYALNF